LFRLVFEDAEVFLLEAVYEFTAVVENGGMEDYQVNVDFDGASLLVVLVRRSRLRSWQGEWVVLGGGSRSAEGEKKKERRQNGLCHCR
jgi:hypothetical protein